VKLNPEFLWQKLHLTRGELFHLQDGLRTEEETIKMLHLEYIFILCWNLDASDSG
jgi:hypothetical protein